MTSTLVKVTKDCDMCEQCDADSCYLVINLSLTMDHVCAENENAWK